MITSPQPADLYLAALFGRTRPTSFVEVRWRVRTGMARAFVSAADLDRVARIVRHRASTEVYVGVLPRWRLAGGRGSVVSDGRTVWVDLDTDMAWRALEPVDPAPSLVVASGGPGHLHAYWTLRRAVAPGVIERANRRLAWALGGDLNSTDAARILRPPETVNHGRNGVPVSLVGDVAAAPVVLGELVGGLPDPPGPMLQARHARPRRCGSVDPLLHVSPERYVTALTGHRVGRNRKVRCPLHDDETPSLHVYRDPGRGWFCFGCRRGGSIYDLAGAVWAIEPRGSGFAALRQGLSVALGLRPAQR